MSDHKCLTEKQKLEALSARFYQRLKWNPKSGDYYTTSRSDLQLYYISKIEGGIVFTNFCDSPSKKDDEWDFSGFTSEGLGPMRVWVPNWVFDI